MKKNKKEPTPKKELNIMRSPTFAKYYVTNAKGGLTSQDFRFELLNEKLQNNKNEEAYISDALVIFSFIGAKRFQVVLNKAISEYEKENGEIPLEPKKDKYI